MEERNLLLRTGLDKLYVAQMIGVMIAVGSLLVVWIPFLGMLAMLAVIVGRIAILVLEVQGLLKLNQVNDRYMTVLMLSIIAFVCGLFDKVWLFEAISTVLTLAAMWVLIKTTNCYLEEKGRTDIAGRGDTVLKINIGVAVVAEVLGLVFMATGAAVAVGMSLIFSVVAMVLSLVSLCLYIGYLSQAKDVF